MGRWPGQREDESVWTGSGGVDGEGKSVAEMRIRKTQQGGGKQGEQNR